ncbi:MAG TPA: nitroreductase [Dehalococcoidia bacterium]|jgi:nitroreductase|nr:nitroreductase [Dehalococcoidia bacterium]
MDTYQLAITRRTIREFKDTPVPYEILEKCVNAARLAPSAGNRQPLEHIIVDEARLLPQVFDAVAVWAGESRPKEGWPPGRRPKAYIVTLINAELEKELGAARRATLCDVGMAVENMILVAWAQGIGSCPVLSFREKDLKELLNIPDKYEVGMVLALGYPDESPVTEETQDSIKYWVDSQGVRHVPKRRLEDILHRNKFR